MDVSIVIPVKDEADSVEPLIRETRAALDGRVEYEIIYVDDGSTDDTVERLLRVRQQGCDALRILQHPRPCGQSTAIYTGVEAAWGRWIVTMDGDGQNDPADIPRLLEVARRQAPVSEPFLVAGYRKHRHDSWLRRLSSRIANAVRSRLLADEAPDTGCGLKLFSRDGFFLLPYFDHMHRFLPALVRRHGGQVIQVEVRHRPRLNGRSKYGLHNRLWVGLADLAGVMWLIRRTRLPGKVREL
ncbi:MAG TPA: glycosyltransferase family 2 protein [Nevskiales bacterium]|nr:glycosyltransferase family 2 protein [Nevskiales bacterium]